MANRYFNDAGEPLMTAAQARFEDYLDDYPRDPYDDLNYDPGDYYEPDDEPIYREE